MCRSPNSNHALTREGRLSLAFHAAIAEKLQSTAMPVLEKARRNVQRLKAQHPHLAESFQRWEQWLNLPSEHLAKRITAVDENAVEMRHVTVFAGVLAPAERNRIIRAQRLEEDEQD